MSPDTTAREPHPAADLFPMLSEDELAALAEDIKQRGLLVPIVLDPEGLILDGRNRARACEIAGVEPRFETYGGDDPYGLVLSANVHRRHLTQAQRRDLIALVLRARPEQSNRQVARQTQADDKTVGTVRRELEGRAEIPHVAEVMDTRGRRQPATRRVAPVNMPPRRVLHSPPAPKTAAAQRKASTALAIRFEAIVTDARHGLASLSGVPGQTAALLRDDRDNVLNKLDDLVSSLRSTIDQIHDDRAEDGAS